MENNNQWGGSYPPPYYGPQQSQSISVSRVMRSVYFKMTLALIVSGIAAMMLSSYLLSNPAAFMSMGRGTWIVLFIVELGIVIGISAGINKLSPVAATLLFYLFAIVNGVTLAPIFLVYTHTSIVKTFFITAGTFGAMSVFGYTTSQDLTKMGNFLFMALIGLIIASVVNIFMHSSSLEWIISIAGVLIFVGLTAWDTQKIKQMAAYAANGETVSKLATIGALNLYLDFINLFLYLLRFFGDRR